MPAPKVMLVEDDPQFVYLMRRYAASSGCHFLHADSASATLELAQQERPDLILLDVMLCADDSREVLTALKADHTTRGIRLYLCSASEEALHEWEHEADGCLLKPVMYEDFLAILTQVRS